MNKVGRPKKDTARTERLEMRLTPTEKENIMNAAKENNMTATKFLNALVSLYFAQQLTE